MLKSSFYRQKFHQTHLRHLYSPLSGCCVYTMHQHIICKLAYLHAQRNCHCNPILNSVLCYTTVALGSDFGSGCSCFDSAVTLTQPHYLNQHLVMHAHFTLDKQLADHIFMMRPMVTASPDCEPTQVSLCISYEKSALVTFLE